MEGRGALRAFVKVNGCIATAFDEMLNTRHLENFTRLNKSCVLSLWLPDSKSLCLCSVYTIVPALPRTFLVCFAVNVPVCSRIMPASKKY